MKLQTHIMSFETENSSSKNIKFFRSDLNFQGYSKESLHLICKYGLLVNTEYPKLVLALIESQEIHGWLQSKVQDPSALYSQIFQFIEKYSIGKPFLHLETEEFWDSLVTHFMQKATIGTCETTVLEDFEAKVTDKLETKEMEKLDEEVEVQLKKKNATRKKKQQRNFWI